jgi:ATP-binding cassette ChvD family protein
MSNEPNKIIYSMVGVSKFYNKKPVLKDISLSYFYGAKIGVIGLNGSGKSSLLRILAGREKEFNGETVLSPGHTVGFLEQEPELDDGKTVREIVEEGVQATVDALNEYNLINEKFSEPMSDDEMNKLIERQGEVQEKLDALDAWDLDSRLEMAMDALRCPPGDTPVKVISGGERRRVALCRLLLQKPDILLLDEPTNHLDAETVAWLEHHLQSYAGTIIAVTHDRYFLDNVAGWILELDRGEGIPWKGNYSSWLEQKKNRLQQEEKSESERQKTLQRELEWIQMTPKGRHAKSRARINSYEAMLSQDIEKRSKELEIYMPPGPRLGNVVIAADNVNKSFGENILMENMTFSLPPGGIVGIIGPNGAGKTTLFRMVTAQDKPDSGSFKTGETVKLAYVDQSRDDLAPDKTIWEVISGGEDVVQLGRRQVNSRAYVARFNFSGSDQQKKVSMLSGGERNRVHLARMMKEEANVLLLDEPTNDLDVNTMRALEEALENFAGCAVVISHDRWFLDRIATHILGKLL